MYFDADSASLNARARTILQQVSKQLTEQKGTLLIEGHTPGNQATAQASINLSDKMATSVRDYLVSLGVRASRLQTLSVGSERPQCAEDVAGGEAANRRVEFAFRSGNSTPTIASLRRTPAGTGLVVTEFTFTPAAVDDPDGDALTYTWTTSLDGGQKDSGTILTKQFPQTGRFTVTVTATDTSGASASASTQVTIGSLDGVWDITCEPKPQQPQVQQAPSPFPREFVATIRQDGANVTGTISGGGLTQSFPAPASLTNSIRSPRQVSFGVESAYNVWDRRDADFYFSLSADDALQTMTGTSQYCVSARAVRRRAAAAK